jgi:Sporulation and spore germination/Immunoglobulin-like domain of bacterial spore germination
MNVRILALVGACIIAAGCGGSGAVDVGPPSAPGTNPMGVVKIVSSSSSTGSAPSGAPSRLRVEVWLERAGRLSPVLRPVGRTPAVVGAAVSGLLAGPTPVEAGQGVLSAIPPGTQLLGISLHSGVATVDLTSEFEGGSAVRQRLSLAQLVYSVTQFPTVHALRLHLDGAPVTAFADGLVLPDPINRESMRFAKLVSPITVTSPGTGTSVRAPLTVSGISVGFETGVTYRLLDSSGHEVTNGASTSACGTVCRGAFSFTIADLGVVRAQRGTLLIGDTNVIGDRHPGPVLRLPVRLLPAFDVTRPTAGATLSNPAVISFRQPLAPRVVVRVLDSHLHVLGRRVVTAACYGRCGSVLYTVRVPFSVAGLEQGYVKISPLHPKPHTPGQVVEIPVALNGG